MGANSAFRRLVKQAIFPLLDERGYAYVQAISKAWDIYLGSAAASEPELELIPFAVKPGETALDLGANFGFYCYHLGRAVSPGGKVYAFEPVPFTYDTLCLVAKLLRFRGVELIGKGCSNEQGHLTFCVPVQNSGAFAAGQAYLGQRNDDHDGKETQVRWHSVKEVTADVVRLDQALPNVDRVSLIKADIEGAELLAFQGAEQIFERHQPSVICEINRWFLDGFNIALEELTGFFFERDYQLFYYSHDRGHKRLRPISPAEIDEDNYVFIHPSRMERFASIVEAV